MENENSENEIFQAELDSLMKSIREESYDANFELLQKLFENVTRESRKNRPEKYIMTKNSIKTHLQARHFMAFMKTSKASGSDSKIRHFFDVAYELQDIYPVLVDEFVFHNATLELRSKIVDERVRNTHFVGKYILANLEIMIANKLNYFKIFLKQLWDESKDVSLVTGKYVLKIFLKYPTARELITKYLQNLKCSPKHPELRIMAVTLMTSMICKEIEILRENDFFRDFILNLITDSQYHVRDVELTSLAIIFHKFHDFENLSPDVRKTLLVIESKLMYEFANRKTLTDTILIERLFYEYLVPFDLPTEAKMKRFFHFYASLHSWVVDHFQNFLLGKIKSRKLLRLWVKFINQPRQRNVIMDEFEKLLCEENCIMESMIFVKRFELYLKNNELVIEKMATISQPDVSCEKAIEVFQNVRTILNSSGSRDQDKLLTIIERGTPFIFDNESIQVLINYIFQVLDNDSIAQELNLDPNIARERGIKLLNVVANCFPEALQTEGSVEKLISHLNTQNVKKHEILVLLANIGKKKFLADIIESESTLIEFFFTCQYCAIEGTADESKASIECLKYFIQDYDEFFDQVLEKMENNSTLLASSPFFLTSLVTLGKIAISRPVGKCHNVGNLIGMVLDFIKNRGTSGITGTEEKPWCKENELSTIEKCYEESIKCVGYWIYGLEPNSEDFQSWAEIYLDIVKRHLFEPFSNTEPRRNRLRAISACAILKLCEIPQFRLFLPRNYFYQLSQMMNDECQEVSQYFIKNLIELLENGSPPRFLPNGFLSFFILLRGKSEFVESARKRYESIIEKRNLFVNYFLKRTKNDPAKQEEFAQGLVEWVPDFSIIQGFLVLAHDPTYKESDDLNVEDLGNLNESMRTFLNPLVDQSCFNCADLLKKITNEISHSFEPDFPNMKEKLWALSELLLLMIKKKQIKNDMQRAIFQGEIKMPMNCLVKNLKKITKELNQIEPLDSLI